MANALTRLLSGKNRTQAEPVPGRAMVRNNAGGFVFELDQWAQLERFLVLGTEGGTFYAAERALTAENASVVDRCASDDAVRTVEAIVSVSSGSLAPKNTPAIFALAVVASIDDQIARTAANAAVAQVCRTGTHLYQYVDFLKLLERRGWGRGLRRSIAGVLTDSDLERLALHAVKYRQRDGWTYRDLLRLSHPVTDDPNRNLLFQFMLGRAGLDEIAGVDELGVVEGFLRLGSVTDAAIAVEIIDRYRLPWEAVPDSLRSEPAVWDALLPQMGVTALTRNLSTLARLKMLTPNSSVEHLVVDRLTDPAVIRRSREHPVRFLDAQLVHASGGRVGRSRGQTYDANPKVLDALDSAFRFAFENVVPSGARTYIGLDVSGSMGFYACAGSAVLTPRDGAAAMAIITAASEPACYVGAFSHGIIPVDITGSMRVRDAVRQTQGMQFSATDCALPMLDALSKGMEVDLFVIYTDNETWFGKVHPFEAIRRYREETGIAARLAVVGMSSTGFSIADPDDSGMIDLVGFSSATPRVLSTFGTGAI